MKIGNILDKLQLRQLSGHLEPDRQVAGVFISDMLSDVMAQIPRDFLWITNQVHENVVAIAYFRHLSGVILTAGHNPDGDTLAKAMLKNVVLFSGDAAAYEIAGRLWQMDIADLIQANG